jgi:hypothetical protein
VKTNHKLFPKQFIDEALQGMPGGVHIVLEGINAYTEEKLYAVGYRYSKKTTLFFVMSPGAGSTRPGKPYEMKYPTEQSNLGIRFVDRPDVVSKYFAASNCIDRHNQVRQFELHLEKCWVTFDPYFRLHTTLLGINVADCWKLAHYHGLLTQACQFECASEESFSIRKFAGVLS